MSNPINRRAALGLVASIGSVTVAGCVEDLEQEIERFGGYNAEEVREEAEHVEWEVLYRNIDEYEGQPVYFPNAQLTDIVEGDGDPFEYVFMLDSGAIDDPHAIWGVWDGSPYREDDRVRLWGVIEGLKTYMSLLGEQSVPKITVVDMELRS